MLYIFLDNDKLKDFHTALQRALNTWENRPEWLVELCDNIEKRTPSVVDAKFAGWELKPYQRDALKAMSRFSAISSGRLDDLREYEDAEHDNAMTALLEEADLPEWAESRVDPDDDGYARLRAQLCTRDGRKCGNAVVIRVFGGNHVVLTDMGTQMAMSRAVLKELFHPPQYIVKPDAVGKRLKACVNEDEARELREAETTARGVGMAATVLATQLGDALIEDGWRDPSNKPIRFGHSVTTWLRNLASEYLKGESRELTAARDTLLRMKYEWRGGELWAPPLGEARIPETPLDTPRDYQFETIKTLVLSGLNGMVYLCEIAPITDEQREEWREWRQAVRSAFRKAD